MTDAELGSKLMDQRTYSGERIQNIVLKWIVYFSLAALYELLDLIWFYLRFEPVKHMVLPVSGIIALALLYWLMYLLVASVADRLAEQAAGYRIPVLILAISTFVCLFAMARFR